MNKGSITYNLQVVVSEPRCSDPTDHNQNDLSKNAEDVHENNKGKVGTILHIFQSCFYFREANTACIE